MWSAILRTPDPKDPHRIAALVRVCSGFSMALYCYARRTMEPAKSEAAVRGFMEFVREKRLGFGNLENRDRLRSFILSAFQDFLDSDRADGPKDKSLDFRAAERWFTAERVGTSPAETTFHRAWARCILTQATGSLADELTAQIGETPARVITAEVSPLARKPFNPDLVPELDLSPSDLLDMLRTARRRLRELLLSTIRETVAAQADVEVEFWDLFKSV